MSKKMHRNDNKIYDLLINLLPLPEVIIDLISDYDIPRFNGEFLKKNKFDSMINKSNGIVTDGSYLYYCSFNKKIVATNYDDCQGKIINRSGENFGDPKGMYIYKSELYIIDGDSIYQFAVPYLRFIQHISLKSKSCNLCVYNSMIYTCGERIICVYDKYGYCIKTMNFEIVGHLFNLCVDNNIIYMCDMFRNQIHMASTTGNYISEFAASCHFVKPKQITIKDECIYVCDNYNIYQFTKFGEIIKKIDVKGEICGFTFIDNHCYVLHYPDGLTIFK